MPSGNAAPFVFMYLIAAFISSTLKSLRLSSLTQGTRRQFFSSRFLSPSSLLNSNLLIPLLSTFFKSDVMVLPLWFNASFTGVASGLPLSEPTRLHILLKSGFWTSSSKYFNIDFFSLCTLKASFTCLVASSQSSLLVLNWRQSLFLFWTRTLISGLKGASLAFLSFILTTVSWAAALSVSLKGRSHPSSSPLPRLILPNRRICCATSRSLSMSS